MTDGKRQMTYWRPWRRAKDLTGQRFGYLTVIKRAGVSSGVNRTARWLCKCDCGNEVERVSQYLRAKHRTTPRSCGCHHGNETHKMSDSRPYRIWSHMRRRCANPGDKDFGNYGARGIVVCAEWEASFDQFWADMGPTYSPLLTLDRIDVNGPYSPTNCRWATVKQQANNTRVNRVIQTPTGEMTVAQAAEAYGVKKVTLRARLNRYGWSVESALIPPKRRECTT